MVADSVAFLHGRRTRGASSTPSTSSTATAATRSSRLRVLEGAAQAGATRLVLCDTNGGTLPARGRAGRARGRRLLRRRRRRRGPPPRRRRHRRGERARRRARRRDPGAGHDQRLRRAHRELQPHHDHPEPHAEDGGRDHPGRPARAAHAGRAPRRRAGEHGAQPAGRVRRHVGVRAQGGLARERDREAPRRVRARRARLRRQRHPLRRVGARGEEHAHAQGEGARAHARRSAAQRPRRHAQADGARGLPLRGGRRVARAADAPRRRLGAGLVRGRVVPGDHRRRRPVVGARRRRPPRRRSRCTSAASA